MRRYTTPIHIFTLPFDTDNISKLRMIYSQAETIVFVKELSDCECKGQEIRTTLTQEETAQLDCKKNYVEIQAHLLTVSGESLVSVPLKVPVEKCFDTEVLV